MSAKRGRGGRRRKKKINHAGIHAGYFKLRAETGYESAPETRQRKLKDAQVLNSLSWTLPGANQSAPDYMVKLSTKGGDFFRFQVCERVVIFQVAVRTKE